MFVSVARLNERSSALEHVALKGLPEVLCAKSGHEKNGDGVREITEWEPFQDLSPRVDYPRPLNKKLLKKRDLQERAASSPIDAMNLAGA